jgi:hypothetical protein
MYQGAFIGLCRSSLPRSNSRPKGSHKAAKLTALDKRAFAEFDRLDFARSDQLVEVRSRNSQMICGFVDGELAVGNIENARLVIGLHGRYSTRPQARN